MFMLVYVCVSADHSYSQPEGWITKGAAQRDRPNAYERRLWLPLTLAYACVASEDQLKAVKTIRLYSTKCKWCKKREKISNWYWLFNRRNHRSYVPSFRLWFLEGAGKGCKLRFRKRTRWIRSWLDSLHCTPITFWLWETRENIWFHHTLKCVL